jgi:hypothetical protein
MLKTHSKETSKQRKVKKLAKLENHSGDLWDLSQVFKKGFGHLQILDFTISRASYMNNTLGTQLNTAWQLFHSRITQGGLICNTVPSLRELCKCEYKPIECTST